MFPAQALAEAMLAGGWQVTLSTDARGARYTGGFPEAVEIEILPSATFARGGILSKASVPFTVAAGIARAVATFREHGRPSLNAPARPIFHPVTTR